MAKLNFLAGELWLVADKFPDYYVSSHGNVMSTKQKVIILKPTINSSGYLRVRPMVNNRPIDVYVHTLVAETFIGKRPTGLVIDHIDGNKTNNTHTNLRYVSKEENEQYAKSLGLRDKKGLDHPGSRLITESLHTIRDLYKNTELTITELAIFSSVSEVCIRHAIRGSIYGMEPLHKQNKRRVRFRHMTMDEKAKIDRLRKAGKSLLFIAASVDKTPAAILNYLKAEVV